MTELSVLPVERLELTFAQQAWPFADERRAEIEAHFAKLQGANPALWNGRVLLMRDPAIKDGVFRGSFFETDYASLLSWRDWGFPDKAVRNCFAMGAIRAADGGYLLGVMGPHTANAGAIYFPAGLTDLDDVEGSNVDFEKSVWREVAEETGLTPEHLVADPRWFTVLDCPRVAQFKILQAHEDAEPLRARILRHLASEKQPELSDIRIVRSPADFEPMVRPFVIAFLHAQWASA
jgi:8-oxo-dGTP pyrophosphatase MutT (NUDIX family)